MQYLDMTGKILCLTSLNNATKQTKERLSCSCECPCKIDGLLMMKYELITLMWSRKDDYQKTKHVLGPWSVLVSFEEISYEIVSLERPRCSLIEALTIDIHLVQLHVLVSKLCMSNTFDTCLWIPRLCGSKSVKNEIRSIFPAFLCNSSKTFVFPILVKLCWFASMILMFKVMCSCVEKIDVTIS